jgi:hypothetical protein
MEINTAKGINGELRPDDLVIVIPSDAYGNLIGRVTEITTDGVHVDFTDSGYSEEAMKNIAYVHTTVIFSVRPLHDVVLTPESLVNITGIDLAEYKTLIENGAAADAYCRQVMERHGFLETGPVSLRPRNAMEEGFEEAIVRGEPSLFTPTRIKRDTVPEGYYVYDLRHDDEDWGEVATIEKRVVVNHYGTVITPFEIELPPEGYLVMESGDFVLIDGGCNRMEQFVAKYPPVPPRLKELLDRLNRNYDKYLENKENLTPKEIIDSAWDIAAHNDAHYFLTESHDFEDEEIEFLLCFQNPLDMVAHEWGQRQGDLGDFVYSLSEVVNSPEEAVKSYSLVPGIERTAVPGLSPKAKHEQIVKLVQDMDYGMDASEFTQQMSVLFPNGNPNAASGWIQRASDFDAEIGHSQAKTLLEYCVEFGLIKKHYGNESALQVYNLSELCCPNVYELRATADLFRMGVKTADVHQIIADNDLMTNKANAYEFGNALIAYVESSSAPPTVKFSSNDEKSAVSVKEKRPIEDRLRDAQVKVNAQIPSTAAGEKSKKRGDPSIN